MDDVQDGFLAPSGMVSARAAMLRNYRWFVHTAPISAFDSINKIGLEPRRPRHWSGPPPATVIRRIGRHPDRVIFLWPKGESILSVGADEGEKLFRVALKPDDLPVRLGVDWSFPDAWTKAARHRNANPLRDIGEIFAFVAEECGSFVVYDPIPPEALVVCPLGGANADQSEWLPLIKCQRKDVEEF